MTRSSQNESITSSSDSSAGRASSSGIPAGLGSAARSSLTTLLNVTEAVDRRQPHNAAAGLAAPLEREIEPDAVAQFDPVDRDVLPVARRRREGVPFDRPHPEPELLIEAQIAGVRGRR